MFQKRGFQEKVITQSRGCCVSDGFQCEDEPSSCQLPLVQHFESRVGLRRWDGHGNLVPRHSKQELSRCEKFLGERVLEESGGMRATTCVLGWLRALRALGASNLLL